MALTDDQRGTLQRLTGALLREQPRLDTLDAYYDGAQRLEQLGLAIPPDLRRFVTIVAWPQLVVDAVEERLDVEGFTLGGAEAASDELAGVWQRNDLGAEASLVHTDALLYGRGYVSVGAGEDDGDPAVIVAESPRELIHESDPKTRQVVTALRRYDGPASIVRQQEQHAAIYEADQTTWLTRVRGGEWSVEDVDEHGLGTVPVQPVVNRARTARRQGVSEMRAVIPVTDAAARALTNAQLATEMVAVPQRYVLGATAGDFVDQHGAPLTAWETYFGSVWALTNPDGKAGQFAAADLGNFVRIVDHYAKLAAGLTGIPQSVFGLSTDNPASADAIRASESRLVKRVERKQAHLSSAWERVMRLALLVQHGELPAGADRLDTLWRDPATPTKAQQADAVVKLRQARVLPLEACWQDLGYGPERRKELRRQWEAEASDPTMAAVAAELLAGQADATAPAA